MSGATRFTIHGVLLRRVDYGDNDLVLTVLTPDRGKLSLIAKNAKKSTRRFGGKLELFSALAGVCSPGRGGRLALLHEADLLRPHAGIRASMLKTAMASYWAELVMLATEDGQPVEGLHELLRFALDALADGRFPDDQLHIVFQMRLLLLTGICPNLSGCCTCRVELERMPNRRALFDLGRGSLACDCSACGGSGDIRLSKGTVKQLRWIEAGDLPRAVRSRFSPSAIVEAQGFLERFVAYHLGREPKSLGVLRQLRSPASAPARPR